MMAAARPSSGVVVPQPLPLSRRVVAGAASILIRLILKTWNFQWQRSDPPPKPVGPVIFCIWHNRLLSALASNDDFAKSSWPGKGLAALISASRDGGLLANIAGRFGIQPIRGSSSRRGPQALLEATTWIERGYNIAITPDGPRGPVYNIQDGIIHLAQVTGCPIIPVSSFTRWKICLRSWDRFQIPLPFAQGRCQYGEPILVPREATEEEREALRAKLESSMLAITRD